MRKERRTDRRGRRKPRPFSDETLLKVQLALALACIALLAWAVWKYLYGT